MMAEYRISERRALCLLGSASGDKPRGSRTDTWV